MTPRRFAVALASLVAVSVAATGAITSAAYGDVRAGLAFCALGVAGMLAEWIVR